MIENQPNPKLQKIKDYLKQQIYKELIEEIKQEVSEEFEKRFILTLQETVKQTIALNCKVTVKQNDYGIEAAIHAGEYYGQPCVTPYTNHQRPLPQDQLEEIYATTTAIVLEKMKQQDLLKQIMAADEADGLYKTAEDGKSGV